jgi:hypothetical protein
MVQLRMPPLKPTFPIPLAAVRILPPAHLGPAEQRLYVDIVRNYGLSGNEVALRILSEALTSLTIAGECHEQIKTEGRIVFDATGPNGEGIGKRKMNPLCVVERDARSAFMVGMKMLNLELVPKSAMSRKQVW